jgi:hypothetical protein
MRRPAGHRAHVAARRLTTAAVLIAGAQFAAAPRAARQDREAVSSPPKASVTIVLPPRLVAGQPATLAVLLSDGKLAREVDVDLGPDVRVRTDPVGRAYFTVPSGAKYLVAKSGASSAAALVDRQAPPVTAESVTVAGTVPLQDSFPICGGGFRGDAESNRVTLGGERALVLAASPECLVVLGSPQTTPGATALSVEAPAGRWDSETTLVSLRNEPPLPSLVAQKKSRLALLVDGTSEPLLIRIQNKTPEILRFLKGDNQVLRTSGGTRNEAAIEVVAIRAGDYSFSARFIAPADPADAEAYLNAAAPLADENLARRLKKLSDELKRHPHTSQKAVTKLDTILKTTVSGDLRTLLVAARESL